MRFLAKTNGQTVAVCDIGSGSIAVGIIEITPDDGATHILASERRSLKLEDRKGEQSIDQLKTLAAETAAAVLESHSKNGGSPPLEVIAVVHAPWVHSETVTKSRRFEGPTVITDAHIRDVAKEAAQGKSTLNSSQIFERGVIRASLNGYPTKKPEGKKASRMEISVLQSDLDPALQRAMEEALGKVFVGRTPIFFSTAFVLNVLIQQFLPTITNYTLIDITSVASSSFVVRGGSMMGHTDAPIGWRAVLAELSAIAGTTQAEALSRMRMIREDVCTDAVCQAVTESLSKVEPKFVQAYGTMFAELVKDKKVPGLVMLVSPPDLSPWFTSMLSRIDFAQFNISERPFTVHQLYGEYLMKNTELASALPHDTGVAAAAGFMHIRAQEKYKK